MRGFFVLRHVLNIVGLERRVNKYYIWCGFVRNELHMEENEKELRKGSDLKWGF